MTVTARMIDTCSSGGARLNSLSACLNARRTRTPRSSLAMRPRRRGLPAGWRRLGTSVLPNPLSQLVANEAVDRLALGRARFEQLLEFRDGSLREGPILEGGGIDVDIERRAAQCRESGQHPDAAVADDVEIAVFAGAPRQCDYLGADPCAVERRFSGTP